MGWARARQIAMSAAITTVTRMGIAALAAPCSMSLMAGRPTASPRPTNAAT